MNKYDTSAEKYLDHTFIELNFLIAGVDTMCHRVRRLGGYEEMKGMELDFVHLTTSLRQIELDLYTAKAQLEEIKEDDE